MAYPESALIDRLVLGRPDPRRLTERILALHEAGWTYAEIAAELGLSRAAVEQRVVRARRRCGNSPQPAVSSGEKLHTTFRR